ncbi:MAG: carbon-nitrogen hydrolase family protein [Verrucomicrobiota bacterium]
MSYSSRIIQRWDWSIKPTKHYRVLVQALPPFHSTPHTVAIAQWFEKLPPANSPRFPESLKSLYLRPISTGWSLNLIAPRKARFLQISLYHWTQLTPPPANQYEAQIDEIPLLSPKKVTLAVAYQNHPLKTTWAKNVALTCKTIENAGQKKVDLLCLSENFLSRGVQGSLETLACEVDSPRLTPVLKAIQKAKLYAVFGFKEKEQDHYYTTAVLVSPQGKIIGKYRKRYLTFSELSDGACPGDDFPVFETEIGKIGMLICWDSWFPETARALARKEVDIICMPIAGNGNPHHWEHAWRARAIDNQLFWMASVTGNCGGVAPSRIIAPDGALLAQTKKANDIAFATVILRHPQETYWLSIADCYAETRNILNYSHRPEEILSPLS